MSYPNWKDKDPTSFKKTNKDDEIEKVTEKTQKQDDERILKSLEIDNEQYKQKYKKLSKKRVLIIFVEISLGSAASSNSLYIIKHVSCIKPMCSYYYIIQYSLLTSIAILITNDYISKLKIKFIKVRDWILWITLLSGKLLKQSMIDEKQMNLKRFLIITLRIEVKKLKKKIKSKLKMFSM